jgi:NAD(P)-dependent dehydrogenase (short-subunit alcohol dehydrogenase family)
VVRCAAIFDLTDKVILITGASSGIGRQCAVTLSGQGARIALLGRDMDRLQETLSMMSTPDMHKVFSHDFAASLDVKEMVEQVVNEVGKLSGIVHSAGISTTLPLRALTQDKVEQFTRVNVHAPMALTKAAVTPACMNPDGASVVFMASVMGVVGEVGKSLYSMTKGALLGASKSLALELAPRKIRVNCLSPGVVESPMSAGAIYSQSEEALGRIRDKHPLGLGSVEDVANACLFLVSDEAKWITGTNFVIDGGYTAR